VSETVVDETLEREHGEEEARKAGLVREDHPELDEALDPEFEPIFEVDIDPELETRDIHEADEDLEAGEPGEGEGAPRGQFTPRSERTVPGMGGKVFDFRGTGLCPPNGGRIRPLLLVHHIPVVPNMKGTVDFITLGNILRGEGLAIQASTDAEGNVALFTRFDEFCFGHRGANQLACGIEHMHKTVDEPWTEKQMRAAAWCSAQVFLSHGVAPRGGVMTPGHHIVGVKRRGHTSHMAVSDLAGFHDRKDPGAGFNFAHLYELTRFFVKHRRF
jgi:N-acetylmuramoyl-L-alanine amidase